MVQNTMTEGKTSTESIGVTEMQKLKNGFTALENLKVCISEGTAIATTFERAIEQEGLTMQIISLIKLYYNDSDYPESLPTEKKEYIGGLPKKDFSTYDAETRAEAIAMQKNNEYLGEEE